MRTVFLASLLTSSMLFGAATVGRTNFEPSYWRYAHRDAQLLAGIDWKAMQTVSSEGAQWQAIGEMLGNVERLLVSSPVSGDKGKLPAHMLVIASGRFDLVKLQKTAAREGAIVTSFKGVQLIGPASAGANEIMLAFVDGRTALLGTKSVIAAALERSQEVRTSPMAEDNDLYASATEISADNDFWLVSNVSEQARKDPAFIFHKVSSFASGYRLENGIHYSIHLNADDEESAKATSKQLHAALSQVNAYFPGALPTRPGLGLNEILANMKVSLDESDVHAWSDFGRPATPKAPQQIAQLKLVDARPVFDANVPIIADERTMKMIRTSPVTGYMPPLPTMPNVPPPPVKRVVRIEGLEDGIREIPYTQSRK